jgi:hypothetical protein
VGVRKRHILVLCKQLSFHLCSATSCMLPPAVCPMPCRPPPPPPLLTILKGLALWWDQPRLCAGQQRAEDGPKVAVHLRPCGGNSLSLYVQSAGLPIHGAPTTLQAPLRVNTHSQIPH